MRGNDSPLVSKAVVEDPAESLDYGVDLFTCEDLPGFNNLLSILCKERIDDYIAGSQVREIDLDLVTAFHKNSTIIDLTHP